MSSSPWEGRRRREDQGAALCGRLRYLSLMPYSSSLKKKKEVRRLQSTCRHQVSQESRTIKSDFKTDGWYISVTSVDVTSTYLQIPIRQSLKCFLSFAVRTQQKSMSPCLWFSNCTVRVYKIASNVKVSLERTGFMFPLPGCPPCPGLAWSLSWVPPKQ